MNPTAVDATPGDAGNGVQFDPVARVVRAIGRLAAVGLGGLHAVAAIASRSMNSDGISYLDMADAFFRGDWDSAVNAYWSPLYAWLLGAGTRIAGASPAREFAVVQLVNLVVYLAALICFEFFWRQLIRANRPGPGWVSFPLRYWWALGHGLFIWSSLDLIEIWAVTPDMCVAACVYLAAGLLLRMRLRPFRSGLPILLGVILGIGYLAKAAMFPLALVFLLASLFTRPDLPRAVKTTSIALIFFVFVTGPFLVSLSRSQGHLTFGESGRLNYVWFVNGVRYPHWQGGDGGNGSPLHATRRICDDPPIHEFDGPVAGTYPPWYDPPYWYAGAEPRFDAGQQLNVLAWSASVYLDLFRGASAGLAFSLLIVYLVAARDRSPWRAVAEQRILLIPSLAAISMYALVLVEYRYLGAFLVLLWAGLLAGVRLPAGERSRRLLAAAGAAMIAALGIAVLAFNLGGLGALLGIDAAPAPAAFSEQAPTPSPFWEVTEGLGEAGIRPGDKIALIGYGFDAFWARQARVQIVAELYPWEAPGLWDADGPVYPRVMDAFARTTARVLVAEVIPEASVPEGWRRIGTTTHYCFLLRE